MSKFKVIDVQDTNAIKVAPRWRMTMRKGDVEEKVYRGDKIEIKGFSIPSNYKQLAIERLRALLLNQEISLANSSIVKSNGDDSVISSKVLINDIDVSYYFPEFRT